VFLPPLPCSFNGFPHVLQPFVGEKRLEVSFYLKTGLVVEDHPFLETGARRSALLGYEIAAK
jgi:hypothetical protein